MRQLRTLQRKGGRALDAFKQVTKAIALWEAGEEAELTRTNWGEKRIPHIVKYDLAGYCRLVVREHEGTRAPLFVGEHEDVDNWLDRNRGADFVIDPHTLSTCLVPIPRSADDNRAAVSSQDQDLRSHGPLFASVPQQILDSFSLPHATRSYLERKFTFDNIWDDLGDFDALSFPSEEVRLAFQRAAQEIASGRIGEGIALLKLRAQAAQTATSNPTLLERALAENRHGDFLRSGVSAAELERLLSHDCFAEWMLFLHPDQEEYVLREFGGPARLLGVSGSGKTVVLVHRAKHLAQKYIGHRILVLTLGRSLARLIEFLLDSLCDDGTRKAIQVKSTYDYCYSMVKSIDPSRLIEQRDPRSGETLEQCWADFREKEHAQRQMAAISLALENRRNAVDGPAYLLDELNWIRSGFGLDDRNEYLECDRSGRGIPFPKCGPATDATDKTSREPFALPADARRRVLQVLADYEEYMSDGGLLDSDGVSLAAFDLRGQLRDHPELRARCVLVDEVQDFSTLELAIIRHIPTDEVDGLFLCGDPVQKVFPKQHNLVKAGIDIIGRGAVLSKNYRNTRQILEAAFKIIESFAEIASIPSSEIIQPEYAYRSGSKPVLYECQSREQQIENVLEWLASISVEERNSTCVCCASPESAALVLSRCAERGIKAVQLSGEDRFVPDGVRVARMEHVKGYEFATVFLLDLSDSVLPARGMPWEERWRDAFHIYVAMTRARDELYMYFVWNRTVLIGSLGDTVEEYNLTLSQ